MESVLAAKSELSKTQGSTPPPRDYVKDLLVQIVSASTDMEARVWLDGVYTDLENNHVHGRWMMDREVYFKVEGRVDRRPSAKQ
ncbi:hypothetical protein AUG19_02340 [archaeon 13_1_20CM_2_54_9]|nr:MAG: hypothetical protein AUJ07_10730 [Crenarchaeota archaeon 13_1_40CM_3_53_5]OLE76606.1 MAG: hypothetical protein AUG19_02340 [archaeon 13_1_20CM_2_54_9]TMI23028.1 MAG: hypothetical protein E6H36_11545 [Candidatus Bathyarchaeota archaeon]TMI33488.1 MAG: hypothetical protein E6H29_00050 [Candidatus Bathyarchaeota archaeon]